MTRAAWTRRARTDLARIDDFNRRRDPLYATAMGRAAIAAGKLLAHHPHAGPVLDDGERKWPVPQTEHVLIYRIDGNGVQILRLDHGREDWRRL